MYVEFHIKASELTEQLLKTIKKVFKDEDVRFFVDDRDETEYLMSSEKNHKMLLRRMKDVEKGKNLVEVKLDDL